MSILGKQQEVPEGNTPTHWNSTFKMNLNSFQMKDVVTATLDDPQIALEFTKAEKPTPNMWAQLASVLTYLQVPYDLTQLFGADNYVMVSGALAASKKLASHNHQILLMYNRGTTIWRAANACQEKLKQHGETLFRNVALDLCRLLDWRLTTKKASCVPRRRRRY